MRIETPSVYLISYPHMDWPVVMDFLTAQGGAGGREAAEWLSQVTSSSDAEALVEFMGRLCYASWVPGINPNVTKVREDSAAYHANVLKSKHGSVLEHANFTFVFDNVSRVFTAELCRHRAGVAISEQSLRYVRLTDIGFRMPPALEPVQDIVISLVETLEEVQLSLADRLGLDNDGVPFAVKKEITSAMRRLAPLGLLTKMGWTANVRTLRHVIAMRTSPAAEEEIREVFLMVAKKCQEKIPMLFQDMTITKDGVCNFECEKV